MDHLLPSGRGLQAFELDLAAMLIGVLLNHRAPLARRLTCYARLVTNQDSARSETELSQLVKLEKSEVVRLLKVSQRVYGRIENHWAVSIDLLIEIA
jgi:hypothetical protein